MKKNILFLCTGNSCRSQMAEGLAKASLGDRFNFYSAGTRKQGMNPHGITVMKEIHIDLKGHYSKTLEELQDVTMDLVFTVCADAFETCPVFHGAKVIHVGFDDPSRLTSELADQAQILEVYRRVRDEIKAFVDELEQRIELL